MTKDSDDDSANFGRELQEQITVELRRTYRKN
jgi:hypothetical protein